MVAAHSSATAQRQPARKRRRTRYCIVKTPDTIQEAAHPEYGGAAQQYVFDTRGNMQAKVD
jgi:hypothetical protein